MDGQPRVRSGSRGALLGAAAALALVLAALGCSGPRLAPGETGAPTYLITGWEVVAAERIDRTWFQYALRGSCINTGSDTAGAAGIAVSRSPHTVVVEDQIRCGPLPKNGKAYSLDTITVRHDRRQPFDPTVLTGALLVWGAETLVSETRADATRFRYEHSAYLINGTGSELDLVATVTSRSPDTEIVDDTVSGRVPPMTRLAALDGFAFLHDRSQPHDPNTLEWQLRFGGAGRAADLDRDGDVDEDDVARLEGCLGSDPTRVCACAAADLDGDGAVDASDRALALAQLGRTGLPVPPPDTTPPAVEVSRPAPGSDPGPPPVEVAGTVSEPLFRLLVNGADGVVAAGAPPLAWSALAPLPAGAPALVVRAIDLACNEQVVEVPLAAGDDLVPPVIQLVVPAQVGAGMALRAVADAHDDVGVAAVALFVDGAPAGERTAPPFVFDVVAPDLPGASLALRAVARDAAGNTSEASAQVLVVAADEPDAPPSIGALRLPASVVPGGTLVAGVDASDDRGVAEVRFTIVGGGSATAWAPPWEAVLQAPADAPVGSQLTVEAEAVDGAGQTARASGTVAVVATADTTPPTVALHAPEEAPPGAELLLVADAHDDQGVATVRFHADGVQVAQRSAPPWEVRVPLPAGRKPGDVVLWTAIATDFAGNGAASAPAATVVVEPGTGFAAGEVYDDATGRPLEGVRVRAVRVAGTTPQEPAPETTTDAAGAYRLALPEGPALLALTRDGYTSAWRSVEVPARGVATPLDARLTPRAAPREPARAEGGALDDAAGGARLLVPPGALAADGALHFTSVGPQSLPLPLPPGWMPLRAFEVEAPAGLASALSLVLDDERLATAPVAARFDAEAGAWRRVALESEPAPARVAVAAPGFLVLAQPDPAPAAPPTPAVGEPLAGVAPGAIPDGASAVLSPSPRVVFADPEARAEVAARLESPAPVPSGTPIEVRFRESYELADGASLRPAPSDQDFLLFREPEGLVARFVATPLADLDPTQLVEGVIDLVARVRTEAPPQVIGPAGGRVKTPDGVAIEVPPGALGADQPVGLAALAPAALGLPADDRYEVLGGVDLDLGGTSLVTSAVLRLPAPAGAAPGELLLLVRPITVLGRAELELVGVATLSGDAVMVGAGGAGLPLPGVRAGGRYALVRPAQPIGFASGEVLRAGAPVADALVRADTLPFVSRTRAGEPRYAVAAALGPLALTATDLASGDAGGADAAIAEAGAVVAVDLELAPFRPSVVSVEPADGATDVPVDVALVVRFDRPMDRASVAAGWSLSGPGGPVAGTLALSADGFRAAFRPAALLAGEASYRLRLAPEVRDRFGNALAGNQPDGAFEAQFTTADVTPPPRPEAGQIQVGEPAAGVVPISGTQGSVEPGALVSVTNLSTGVVHSVLAGPDGSFQLTVEAGLTDGLSLVVLDGAGNVSETLDLGRPPAPEGFAVLGRDGGIVEGPGGIAAAIPPSVLPPDTVVALEPIPVDDIPTPFEDLAQGHVAGAVSLSLGGAEIDAPAQLELEIEGFPQFAALDVLPPLHEIDRTITLPDDLAPGRRLVVRAIATGESGRQVVAEAALEIAAQPDHTRRHERVDGSLVVELELPAEAAPGEAIRIVARAEYPDVRLRFPADPSLTGDEQFLLWEVEEVAGRTVWDLVTAAQLVTLDDGSRVIETQSPPYRGIRRDTSKLLLAVHAQFAMGFAQVMTDVTSLGGTGVLGSAFAMASNFSDTAAKLVVGTELLLTFSRPPGVDLNPFEFSVVPVPAGSPTTLRLVDLATNRLLATAELAALPPGAFSSVLVLGQDDGPPQVTATPSSANHAVPTDASFTIVFSHLVDPATITPDSLKLLDANGEAVDYRIEFNKYEVGGEKKHALSVTIFPLERLAPGSQYTLRADTSIARPTGQKLLEPFELTFTTAGPPEVVGTIQLPFAQSFDVLDLPAGDGESRPVALVVQRASLNADGSTNRFVSVDLADPTSPVLRDVVDVDARHSGPLRAIRGLADVDLTAWNGAPITGSFAVVAAGSTDVFSTVRFYAIDEQGRFDHRAGVLVSTPTEELLASAELLVIPKVDYNGTISDIEVTDVFAGVFDGIPKTPAIPGAIDTDGERTVYFVNYGVGLMTIDVPRAIPAPPVALRGSQLGPSYAPVDKTGALVVYDDGSLLQTSPHLLVTAPEHLAMAPAAETEVEGLIGRPEVDRVLVNGVEAEIDDGADPGARPFRATIRLREGPNEIVVTPFEDGVPLPSARRMVLRPYAFHPLAGPGTVRIDLDPIQIVDGTVTVTAEVDDVVRFDAIFVNGVLASEKQCPIGTIRRETKSCGWDGRGTVTLSVPGGVSTVAATAVDYDDEGFGLPSFSDLRVAEGLALAVRNDLFLYDASSLVPLATVPIGDASRVSVARQVLVDVDGDGRVLNDEQTDGDEIGVFEELRNLALVGGGTSGRLVFVDVTEPHRAKQIGSLAIGSPVYRAEVLPVAGTAWVAAGDSVVVVDLSRAHEDEMIDDDDDGVDDRIVARIPLPGAYDIRLDPSRGFAYVLQRDVGIAVLRMDACATDIGVDATRIPASREIFLNTLTSEKNELAKAFLAGMSEPECAPFSLAAAPGKHHVAVRSQGSSACLWTEPVRCSTAYQPGISDHDFLFFFPPDSSRDEAATCTRTIEKKIKEKLPEVDLSIFPEPMMWFVTGYRGVERHPTDGCGGGDDPFGDGCLGRNGLMLKWLLEGEWVKPEGAPAWDGGLDEDDVLRTLRSFLPSYFLKEESVDFYEPSRVPRLEGYEWAVLQKYRVEETLARLRLLGSNLIAPEIVDPKLHSKLHKVGKAAIRAVLGKLLATQAGNDLILAANRQDYRSPQGCLTRTSNPDAVSSIGDFRYKPCETFEEYVASRAIESCAKGLGILDCPGEALLAYEFFRIKSDVGRPPLTEGEANAFIARAIRYIDSVVADPVVRAAFEDTVVHFRDEEHRRQNVEIALASTAAFLPGGSKFQLKVPLRIFNRGYGVAGDVQLDVYHQGAAIDGMRIGTGPPGESRFLSKRVVIREPVVPPPGEVASVALRLDPDDEVVEYDESNNFDGFFYYYLTDELIAQIADGDGGTTPPACSGPNPAGGVPASPNGTCRPDPPAVAALPDPPASAVCLDQGAAPPSPGVELVGRIEDVESYAFEANEQELTRTFHVRNTGNVDLFDLVIQDALSGPIAVGNLAAGEQTTVTVSIPTSELGETKTLVSTIQGVDAGGNGIGVASTLTRAVKVAPEPKREHEPVILIPGMAGSVLEADGVEYWAAPLAPWRKPRLTLDPALPQLSIEATDILRTVKPPLLPITIDVYQPLIDALVAGGYEEYPVQKITPTLDCDEKAKHTLFVFPYDWRTSNAEKVDRLDELVECVRRMHPNRRIHVVAHSMGGLLARRYLVDKPGRISKVVTIGSPFVGAPKVLNTLGTGEFLDHAQGAIISSETLRTLAEFFPGAHELMPSRAYFERLGGRPFADASGPFDYEAYRTVHDTLLHPRGTPAANAEAFHDRNGEAGAQDDWSIDRTFAEYFHVYGEQDTHQTIERVTVVEEARLGIQFGSLLEFAQVAAAAVTTGLDASALGSIGSVFVEVVQEYDTEMGPGDGTVPTLSATRKYRDKAAGESAPDNLNAPQAWLWAAPGGDSERDHNGMLANERVHEFVLSVLHPDHPEDPTLPEGVEAAR